MHIITFTCRYSIDFLIISHFNFCSDRKNVKNYLIFLYFTIFENDSPPNKIMLKSLIDHN